MPAQRSSDVATDVPEAGREGHLARPRAVVDGVLGSANRLVRLPHDLAEAQYELARGLVSNAVVVDVVVNVDVASRRVSPGA